MIKVDTTAQLIFDELIDLGASVYLVGGCVRDHLLNIDCKDIDVEVYHIDYDQLVEVLSHYGKVKTYGHFAISSINTLSNYDFALPRKEYKNGDKHTDFNVDIDPNLSLDEATRRRDLTVNALMYDVKTKEIIDLHEGMNDLKNKILRCVDSSTFVEDPLRVYRLASFISRFSFDVDDETKKLCIQMVESHMLEYLSVERVEEEYNKILMSDNPALGFMFLESIGALPSYLHNLSLTHQRPDYHPEGNVFIHTMMVLSVASQVKQYTSNPSAFMWACLLHDIGKPIVSDGYHAKGHEKAGATLFEKEVNMPLNKKKRKYIQNLIEYHMALMYLRKQEDPKYAYYLLLRELNETPVEDLLLMTECDKLGRGHFRSDEWLDFYSWITTLMNQCGTSPLKPYIMGRHLEKYDIQKEEYTDLLEKYYLMQCKGNSKEELLRKLEETYDK